MPPTTDLAPGSLEIPSTTWLRTPSASAAGCRHNRASAQLEVASEVKGTKAALHPAGCHSCRLSYYEVSADLASGRLLLWESGRGASTGALQKVGAGI